MIKLLILLVILSLFSCATTSVKEKVGLDMIKHFEKSRQGV